MDQWERFPVVPLVGEDTAGEKQFLQLLGSLPQLPKMLQPDKSRMLTLPNPLSSKVRTFATDNNCGLVVIACA
jgi:hypothetical protein